MRFAAPLVAVMVAAAGPTGGVADTPTSDPHSTEQRVVDVAYRLAMRGVARCRPSRPILGLQWQVLAQFAPRDRAAAVAAYRLDRGPRVMAVAAGSSAALAGLRADDTLLAVNGVAVSGASDRTATVSQAATLAALDAVDDRLEQAGGVTIDLLRDDGRHRLSFAPVAGCATRTVVVHSDQHDAFADGTHVILPDALVVRLADDDQLALLVAHEMAHNILGHAAALRTVPAAARRALARRQEDEADALGVDLALDAGYDVVRGSRVFLAGGGGLFRSPTHRSGGERMKLALARVRQRVVSPTP